VGDSIIGKSPDLYLRWLAKYFLGVARSVSLRGSLGCFNALAEVWLLTDDLRAAKTRAGFDVLCKIKLDTNLLGSGASGYVLSFVQALGGAIDLMVEALRFVSADLFGVSRLKEEWHRMQEEDWFLSLCSWNNPFQVISDWFFTVSRGLGNWGLALGALPVAMDKFKTWLNLIVNSAV
jgi:hypothetical protein